MEARQLDAVMQAAGCTIQQTQDRRLRQAFKLFMAATSVQDIDMLANEILELRRGREHVRCTD